MINDIIDNCTVALIRENNIEPYVGKDLISVVDLDNRVIDTQELKSALYDLILKEVVGDDEDESRDTDGKEWNEDRNELRQEMRNKLKELLDETTL